MSKYFDEEGNYVGKVKESANYTELNNGDSFPNAKICLLFLIIAEGIMLAINCISGFMLLTNGRGHSVNGLVTFLLTVVGSAFLVLLLRIIGLGFGKKDSEDFAIAFKLEIAAIIVSVGSSIIDNRSRSYSIFYEPKESFLFDKAIPFVTTVLEFFAIYYTIAAIKTILITYNQLQFMKLANLLTIIFVVSAILDNFVAGGTAMAYIRLLINIAFSVLMLILLVVCRKKV